MKILFFSEISTFPVTGGERIRSYGLLKALSELGHNIDAIISNSDKVDLENVLIENIRFIEKPIHSLSILEKITGLHYFTKDRKVINIFNELTGQEKYDLAFLDYGFIGQYIQYFKTKGIPVIYGTHNAQSNLTLNESYNNIVLKLRKNQHAFLQKIHERYFFPFATTVIAVSENDKQFHSAFCDVNKVKMVRNFLDEKRYDLFYEKEDYFIMSANFGAYMNFEGLNWFITHIWDRELDSNFKLLLVGKYSSDVLSRITAAKEYSNIFGIGRVDDINPYIGKAKAALVPLLHGSGTRLKCLEAMALKTPILSTPKGVEGIESEHFIIFNNAEDFKKAILDFKFYRIKGELLYKDFLSKYSISANLPYIKGILDSLTSFKC